MAGAFQRFMVYKYKDWQIWKWMEMIRFIIKPIQRQDKKFKRRIK
jgi:hypothetical protein